MPSITTASHRRFRAIIGDAVAFVLGAAVAIMMVNATGKPGPMPMVTGFLNPGFPLAGLVLQPFAMAFDLSLDWVWVLVAVSAIVNGLVYVTARRVVGMMLSGVWGIAIPLVLVVGAWTMGYVARVRENQAATVPPPAPSPLDVRSPLAGRWDGIMHGATGNPPVVMICRPRMDGTLDGLMWTDGYFNGPFENGRFAGDSLNFELEFSQQRGARDSTRMSIASTMSGSTQMIDLQFTSADTTAPPELSLAR